MMASAAASSSTVQTGTVDQSLLGLQRAHLPEDLIGERLRDPAQLHFRPGDLCAPSTTACAIW